MVGFGSGDWRCTTYRRLWEVADQQGVDVFEALASVSTGMLAIPYSSALVSRWKEFEARRKALAPLLEDLPHLVETLIPETAADLALLRELAMSSLFESGEDELQLLTLVRSGIAQPEVPIEASKIRIMSFHKSKGLTADVVVLAGLVEGLMPQAPDSGDPVPTQESMTAEQRRLFYVGLTRTRRILVDADVAIPRDVNSIECPDDVLRDLGHIRPMALTHCQSLPCACQPPRSPLATWPALPC